MAHDGLLAVWMNIDPADQADFDGWYNREHIAERLGVPGFINGSRYVALRGEPRFLALYDTHGPEVLGSAAYLERLNNPTPWTQRVMPTFKDTIRCVCRIVAGHGGGVGGVVRAIRLEPAPGREEELGTALEGMLPVLAGQAGIIRARLAATEKETGSTESAETGLRGKDQRASLIVLVEGTDEAALGTACDEPMSEARLSELGAAAPVPSGDYRLLYSLTNSA